MSTMLSPRQFLLIPLLAAAIGVAAAPIASAQQVDATAQTIQAVESGAFADVQFRITVTNGESSVASNVSVVFADGLQVNLGDVGAGGSAVSAPETRVIDVSAEPSRNVPVPVTVKFTLDGVNVELDQTLVIFRGAPAGEGQ